MSAWLNDVWRVVKGSARVARRNKYDVARYCSEQVLLDGARDRGYHVALVGNQYFIFRDPIDVKL